MLRNLFQGSNPDSSPTTASGYKSLLGLGKAVGSSSSSLNWSLKSIIYVGIFIVQLLLFLVFSLYLTIRSIGSLFGLNLSPIASPSSSLLNSRIPNSYSPTCPQIPAYFQINSTTNASETSSFQDDYLWLREIKTNSNVTKYIEQENSYTDKYFSSLYQDLIEKIVTQLDSDSFLTLNISSSSSSMNNAVGLAEGVNSKKVVQQTKRSNENFDGLSSKTVMTLKGSHPVLDVFDPSSKIKGKNLNTKDGPKSNDVLNDNNVPSSLSNVWLDDSYVYWNVPGNAGKEIYYRNNLPPSSSVCSTPLPLGNPSLSSPTTSMLIDFNKIFPNAYNYWMIGIFEVLSFSKSSSATTTTTTGESLLAFSIDTVGDENFQLYVYNYNTHSIIWGPVNNTYYSARWHSTLYRGIPEYWIVYNIVEKEWGVPLSIGRSGPFSGFSLPPRKNSHSLNPASKAANIADATVNEIIYGEPNPSLTVELDQSNDLEYLFIKIAGLVTSEYRIVQSSPLTRKPILTTIFPRVQGVYYDITHSSGLFYVRINDVDTHNFRVVAIDVNDVDIDDGVEIWGDNANILIERIEAFGTSGKGAGNVLVCWYRTKGLRNIKMIDLSTLQETQILDGASSNSPTFPSGVYSAVQDLSLDWDARVRRPYSTNCFTYVLSSLLKPPTLYSYNLLANTLSSSTPSTFQLLNYVSGKDLTKYKMERRYGLTKDTSQPIPISLVYLPTDSATAHPSNLPLFAMSYGAYGGFIDPAYDSSLFSLLDAGFAVAIFHPRGDGDLGSSWYTQGKYELKGNTLEDSFRCLEALVEQGVVDKGRIAFKGRSAGGLIAGNFIVNGGERSGLVGVTPKVVVANVPFIDPIYDLIDETVPWTTYELFEWGSPYNSTILKAMIGYSPYHNIDRISNNISTAIANNVNKSIPATYISAGLEDSRVPFWEPLKFTAKLRAAQVTGPGLFIRVDGGGHFSAHGSLMMAEWIAFCIVYTL